VLGAVEIVSRCAVGPLGSDRRSSPDFARDSSQQSGLEFRRIGHIAELQHQDLEPTLGKTRCGKAAT
jgi:hypothetical protein